MDRAPLQPHHDLHHRSGGGESFPYMTLAGGGGGGAGNVHHHTTTTTTPQTAQHPPLHPPMTTTTTASTTAHHQTESSPSTNNSPPLPHHPQASSSPLPVASPPQQQHSPPHLTESAHDWFQRMMRLEQQQQQQEPPSLHAAPSATTNLGVSPNHDNAEHNHHDSNNNNNPLQREPQQQDEQPQQRQDEQEEGMNALLHRIKTLSSTTSPNGGGCCCWTVNLLPNTNPNHTRQMPSPSALHWAVSLAAHWLLSHDNNRLLWLDASLTWTLSEFLQRMQAAMPHADGALFSQQQPQHSASNNSNRSSCGWQRRLYFHIIHPNLRRNAQALMSHVWELVAGELMLLPLLESNDDDEAAKETKEEDDHPAQNQSITEGPLLVIWDAHVVDDPEIVQTAWNVSRAFEALWNQQHVASSQPQMTWIVVTPSGHKQKLPLASRTIGLQPKTATITTTQPYSQLPTTQTILRSPSPQLSHYYTATLECCAADTTKTMPTKKPSDIHNNSRASSIVLLQWNPTLQCFE